MTGIELSEPEAALHCIELEEIQRGPDNAALRPMRNWGLVLACRDDKMTVTLDDAVVGTFTETALETERDSSR